ncbi:ricin B lectin domain-containing protein [Mycena galopus ATCC 62051]|nr:ricin B lectin domain-containing protein [Mycena galopus ATCC 62051]
MPIFKGTYTITNLASKTCVDLNGGNSADGTAVQGWTPLTPDAAEYLNQVWEVLYTNKLGCDSYTICNVGTKTYVQISDGNATDGTPVTCAAAAGDQTTADYQEWELVKVDNSGYYKVCNRKSQNYLDIDAGSSANATKLQGWYGLLDGNPNQLWKFDPVNVGGA